MENKRERTIWTREETRAFLLAYNARKAEFEHVKRRKVAMQNVIEDLQSQGILSTPKNVGALELKLKNLLQAWKATKDNNGRTGASPSIAPYGDLMEDIFGDRPIISNTHTLNLSGEAVSPLRVSNRTAETPPGRLRVSPRENYYFKRLAQKKEADDKRNEILEKYKSQKIFKMEEAEQNKNKRHLEKMKLLKQILLKRKN